MVIGCLIKYFERFDIDMDITIVSNDSDFIQLLSDNVRILDWSKDIIDENNWVEKTKGVSDFLF